MARPRINESSETVEIDCKIKKETGKAICISTYDPEYEGPQKEARNIDIWFPISTCTKIERNAGTDLGDLIVVDYWIAAQKGLT